MTNPRAQSGTDQHFRTLQLIYFAMLFSLASYLVIGLLLRPSLPPFGRTSAPQTLIEIFYFLSAGLVALVYIIRKKLYRKSPEISPSPVEVSKQQSFYRTGHLLLYVFIEAIGLLGLILLLMTGSIQHFVNLTLVSFILLVVLYPCKMAGSTI